MGLSTAAPRTARYSKHNFSETHARNRRCKELMRCVPHRLSVEGHITKMCIIIQRNNCTRVQRPSTLGNSSAISMPLIYESEHSKELMRFVRHRLSVEGHITKMCIIIQRNNCTRAQRPSTQGNASAISMPLIHASEHSKELMRFVRHRLSVEGHITKMCIVIQRNNCTRAQRPSTQGNASAISSQPMHASEHSKELMRFVRHRLSVEGHITKMCIIIQRNNCTHARRPSTQGNASAISMPLMHASEHSKELMRFVRHRLSVEGHITKMRIIIQRNNCTRAQRPSNQENASAISRQPMHKSEHSKELMRFVRHRLSVEGHITKMCIIIQRNNCTHARRPSTQGNARVISRLPLPATEHSKEWIRFVRHRLSVEGHITKMCIIIIQRNNCTRARRPPTQENASAISMPLIHASEHSKELMRFVRHRLSVEGHIAKMRIIIQHNNCTHARRPSTQGRASAISRQPMHASEHSKELMRFVRHRLSVEGHITKMCIIIQRNNCTHARRPSTQENASAISMPLIHASEHSKELMRFVRHRLSVEGHITKMCIIIQRNNCTRVQRPSTQGNASTISRQHMHASEHSKELMRFVRHRLSVEGHITKMCIIIQRNNCTRAQRPSTQENASAISRQPMHASEHSKELMRFVCHTLSGRAHHKDVHHHPAQQLHPCTAAINSRECKRNLKATHARIRT